MLNSFIEKIPGKPGTKQYETRVKAITKIFNLFELERTIVVVFSSKHKDFPNFSCSPIQRIYKIHIDKTHFEIFGDVSRYKFTWKSLKEVKYDSMYFKMGSIDYKVSLVQR